MERCPLRGDAHSSSALAEIRGQSPGALACVEPYRSRVALRFDALGVGAAHWRLARAERELARLHVSEWARLLEQAARIRGARADAPALAVWRAAFLDELAASAADGARTSVRLHRLISACCREDVRDWPGAGELARAARALRPRPRATLAFGRCG